MFAASPSFSASATLVIFIPPALMPSLPIVTVLVSPAAPPWPAAVLAIDTPSVPKVIVEPGLPAPVALLMD